MKKLLARFLRMFVRKQRWKGTPEMFLALAIELQKGNDKQLLAHEVLKWGDVLLKLMKVDLRPYRDFADLASRGTPDFDAIREMLDRSKEMNQRNELKKALYGPHTNLGDDEVMTSNSRKAVLARKMFADLSEHVIFPEEDQQIINGWKKE